MKWWPWRRAPKASAESEEALRQADRALLDAQRRDAAAECMADRLRETRARNHFGEAVARSMRRA